MANANTNTYRGLKGAESVWNGCYSDPTVNYKNVSFCLYDVEEMLYNDVIECYGQERDLTEDEIESHITPDDVENVLELLLDGIYQESDYIYSVEMTKDQQAIIQKAMKYFKHKVSDPLDFIAIGFVHDGMFKSTDEIIKTCKELIDLKERGEI